MKSEIIVINNLTDRQIALADILWECGDMHQVTRFIESLPSQEMMAEAETIVELMILSNIDNIIDGTRSLAAANDLIEKVKNKRCGD